MDDPVTESRNPASAGFDGAGALEIVRVMNAEDARVAEVVAEQVPVIAQAVEEIVARLRRGGRLLYVGAGTSGRLGALDAAECPPTFGTPPELVVGVLAGGDRALREAREGSEDDEEGARRDLEERGIRAEDVVVGISASGRTPYTLSALAFARQRGAYTLGITCNPATALHSAADRTVTLVVGPEVVSGSTRLKAGTATKMVLNMLSTASMVLLGRTRGNLMTHLRPGSGKLRQRAVALVRTLVSASEEEAAAALEACSGDVERAVRSLAGEDAP